MDSERKLRRYIIKKYGELPMSTPIVKMTKVEREKSYCEMCKQSIALKKSFVYESIINYLTKTDDMTICETCAKREHGPKNKYKFKDLVKDLSAK